MKTLIKATLIVTIFAVATRGISFIYRIYISRMIGAEGMGLYQIVLSLFSVFVTITSSGIPVTVSKQTAAFEAQNNNKASFSVVTAALIVGLAFSVGISAVVFLFKDALNFLFADPRCMPIFILLLPAVITSSMYSAFRGGLWGKRNYTAYSIGELAEEITMVVSGIILLQGIITIADGARNAVLSITISYIGGALITVLLYFMKGGKLASPKGYFKPLLKSAVPITALRIVTTLLQTVVAFILPSMLAKYMSSAEAIASYGTMMGMTFPLLFLPSTLIGSLALVLVPELSMQRAKGETQALKSGIERAFSFAVYITAIILPVYLGLGEDICTLLYKNTTAGTYLRFAAILVVPLGLTQICSTMLNSLGMEIRTFFNSLLGSILLVLSCIFLPQYIGIYAVIVGFILSLTVSLILNTFQIRKEIHISLKFVTQLVKILLIVLPCALLCGTLNGLLKLIMPQILSIGISAICGTLMLITLTVIFKIADLNMFAVLLKGRKQRG